ncbi:FAD-dependent oxidoreductase [Aspergillus lucknowensis]|uniref:FAD-binding domain-containing protein n=1 Tax=Aspergillus lucknowensis TaxID=176173 RepID=A0ABR4LW46_9EURO
MTAFRVLIIGGGVTGLSLAASLERYGIEYTLLEKHDGVTPSIGASIALLAHGARVVDQLGCFEELLPFGGGVEDLPIYGPDGELLGTHDKIGTHLDQMLGYRMLFVERQRLLHALWGAIRDKSKVQLSSRVARIEHVDGGVKVETDDGRIFTGDFVVGADGVHSKSRDEMWRLAEADKCDITSDRKAIKSSRGCLFGTSHGLAQVKPTDYWMTARQDRHYLVCSAPNGLTFWFVFFTTRKQGATGDTPWYPDEQKERYATEFASDQIRPDVTLGDLYRTSTNTGVVPVEEFVLKRYFYQRILLLGDSAHKMHPVTGHGGNAAIEDAAFLANRLKEVLDSGQTTPSYLQLQGIFFELQEARRPRTEMLTKDAREFSDLFSFDNRILKLIILHAFPKFPREIPMNSLAEAMTAGEALKYIPLPARSKGLTPYDDEVPVVARRRSAPASYVWISMFLSVGLLRYFLSLGTTVGVPGSEPSAFSSWWHYSVARSHLCVNAFWVLESYRSAFLLSPLFSPLPWAVLSIFIGCDTTLAVYFSLWILGSRSKGFYYPFPRAVPPAAAQALPIALAMSLCSPAILTNLPVPLPAVIYHFDARSTAHFILPVVTSLLKYQLTRSAAHFSELLVRWTNFDLSYINGYFFFVILDSGTTHLLFMTKSLIPAITARRLLPVTAEIISFGTLTLLIALWLLFTLWDLRRVNIVSMSFGRGTLYILLGLVLIGPGATLMAAWWLRERAWERARQRVSDKRYGPSFPASGDGFRSMQST